MIYYINNDGSIAGCGEVPLPEQFYVGCERVEHDQLPSGDYKYINGSFVEVTPNVISEPRLSVLTPIQYKGWLGADRYVEIMSLRLTDPKVSYYIDLMEESFASLGYIGVDHPLTLEGLGYLQSLQSEHLTTILDEFKAEMGG